jgi:hypothetical protein
VTLRLLGITIEDEWNLQLLHSFCNRVKRDRLTAQALDLAAAHGITLTGVPMEGTQNQDRIGIH